MHKSTLDRLIQNLSEPLEPEETRNRVLPGKAQSGDVYVWLGRRLLERHEWGLAFKCVELAVNSGRVSRSEEVTDLYLDICRRLDRAPPA